MGSKYTKRHSEEFERDAIALVASSGRTATEVAREPEEYTFAQFRDQLGELGLRQSMGRTGVCFDNAAESFFAIFKEEIGTRIWDDRAGARADIFTFIERAERFAGERMRRGRVERPGSREGLAVVVRSAPHAHVHRVEHGQRDKADVGQRFRLVCTAP